jgi:acylphosphatase
MLADSGANPAPAEAYNKSHDDGRAMTQRRTVLFSGEVQGVGFRATTCRLAAGRAITGYVRNPPDGRVELVAEGLPEPIDALVRDLKDYFGDMIHEAASTTAPATGEYVGFGLRR